MYGNSSIRRVAYIIEAPRKKIIFVLDTLSFANVPIYVDRSVIRYYGNISSLAQSI